MSAHDVKGHSVTYRVYFEDTDAGGVMYHGNYINFCERARTEVLLDCGYTNRTLQQDTGILFVVRHIDADYRKPLLLEDQVDVVSSIVKMGGSSMIFRQRLMRGGECVFQADVTLVCVDANSIRPTRIGRDIKDKFLQFYEGERNE